MIWENSVPVALLIVSNELLLEEFKVSITFDAVTATWFESPVQRMPSTTSLSVPEKERKME